MLSNHANLRRLCFSMFKEPSPVMMSIILALVEVLLLLLSYWSLNIHFKFHYQKTTESNSAHFAFYPKQCHGTPGIVKLIREKAKPPFAMLKQK